MARCRCQSENCTCQVAAGDGIDITGSGSPSDPWVITSESSSSGTIQVVDSVTIDMVLEGTGTVGDPYLISANASTVPGGISTDFGISGAGNALDPLRLNICTYDDLVAACAPGTA
jgi:hypothetical protein